VTTLPRVLASAFTLEMIYPSRMVEYKGGESEAALAPYVDASAGQWPEQRRFRMTCVLPPALLVQLRDFYVARKGPTEPFYYYYPPETNPPYTPNPAGNTGRYTVRFDGGWNQETGMARSAVDGIGLIQVA
jgi:hypothetical protein